MPKHRAMASHILRRANKIERRRVSRSAPELIIEGIDLTTGATVRLRNFSSRSFAVESPDAMTDRRTREFEFPLGCGKIAFKGTPKRRERMATSNGRPQYLVAFEFTWKTPSGRLAIEQFVRAVRGEVA